MAWLTACDAPSALTPHDAAVPGGPSLERIHNQIFLDPPPDPQDNPCPPAELVQIVGGRFHVNEVIDIAPDGSERVKVHFNAMGFEGVGLTSGDRYRIMDNDKVEVEVGEGTFTLVSSARFRLIREGSADNLWLRVTLRILEPGGDPVFDRFEIECR